MGMMIMVMVWSPDLHEVSIVGPGKWGGGALSLNLAQTVRQSEYIM